MASLPGRRLAPFDQERGQPYSQWLRGGSLPAASGATQEAGMSPEAAATDTAMAVTQPRGPQRRVRQPS